MQLIALARQHRLAVELALAATVIAVAVVVLHVAADALDPAPETASEADVPEGWWSFSEGYISGIIRREWRIIVLDRNSPAASAQSVSFLPSIMAERLLGSLATGPSVGLFVVLLDPQLGTVDNIQFAPACATQIRLDAPAPVEIIRHFSSYFRGAIRPAAVASFGGRPTEMYELQPTDPSLRAYMVPVNMNGCQVLVSFYSWRGDFALEDFRTFLSRLQIDPGQFPK